MLRTSSSKDKQDRKMIGVCAVTNLLRTVEEAEDRLEYDFGWLLSGCRGYVVCSRMGSLDV
jgi:hypothetical protein